MSGSHDRRDPPEDREPPSIRAHSGADALENLSAQEKAAIAQTVGLDAGEKLRVIAMRRVVASGDSHAILGVAPGADRAECNRALVRCAREFDLVRYGGRNLGPFRDWLVEINDGVNAAYTHLCLGGSPPPVSLDQLVRRGHDAEAIAIGSNKVQVEAGPEALQHAARRALDAGDVEAAERFARRAIDNSADDVGALSLLAAVYRRSGEYKKAASILHLAVGVCRTSDPRARSLHRELRAVTDLIKHQR